MYIDGRPCMEVVQQLAAARASIDTLILGLLRDRAEKRLKPIADGSQEGVQRLLVANSRYRKTTCAMAPPPFIVRIDRKI